MRNNCPLCNREGVVLQRHHLETRKKDRNAIESICVECHKTIHGLFTNVQLRDSTQNLDSIDGLLLNERFGKALEFIKRVAPGTSIAMHQANSRKKRR